MHASGAESAPGLGHAPATSAQLGSPLQCWARLRSRLACLLCAECCMQVACCLLRVACCMVHVVCAQVTISGQLDGRSLAAWLVTEFETGRWSSLQTRCARVQRTAWGCTALQDGVLHCNSALQQNILCCNIVYYVATWTRCASIQRARCHVTTACSIQRDAWRTPWTPDTCRRTPYSTTTCASIRHIT
jgi:hypothetical protein